MLRAAGFAGIPSFTWATKPATATNGFLIFASDVGEGGTVFQYSTGLSRWRPVNGTAGLKTLAAASANIANTETIVLQTQLPVGAWQTNDAIRMWLTLGKSGATDSLVTNIRVGTAGTTGDTAVIPTTTLMVAAGLGGGYQLEMKLASATTVQRLGSPGNSTAYTGSIGVAVAAPVTITDASANSLFISVGIASSGTTDTVKAISGAIQLVTV